MRRMATWMLAGVLIPGVLGAQGTSEGAAGRPSVATSAVGEVRVVPDRATIFLGVQTQAATAQAAGADNARRLRAVLDTIRRMGVPDERIRTSNLSVYPERTTSPDGRTSKVTGYTVSNVVQVQVHDLTRLGAIIDAALAKGANQVNSLQFESTAADSARRTALGDAVRNARADADAIAAAAGRCVGSVLELSTNEAVRPFVMERAMMSRQADAAPTPIEPGEQVISVTVTGRWALGVAGSCR